MASVTISGVTKSYGNVTVLQEFNQKFEDGEFITLLGPSGCGKTTMLRLIAGFEKPTTGEIYIGDRLVSGNNSFIPPEKREIGMVFQSYAVWPHMNVFDNIAYPLKIKKIPKSEIEEKVNKALKIVHLDQYRERFPSELSGGQQQRVALGRALVAQPEILLDGEGNQQLPYKNSLKGDVIVAIRPENIILSEDGEISGKVFSKFYLGDYNDLRVKIGNKNILRVLARASTYETLEIGEEIRMKILDYFVFEDDGKDQTKIMT